jgi:hypothetical protein
MVVVICSLPLRMIQPSHVRGSRQECDLPLRFILPNAGGSSDASPVPNLPIVGSTVIAHKQAEQHYSERFPDSQSRHSESRQVHSANAVAATLIVLDGEIVCLDRKGRPEFRDLLFRRGDPCFFAFDLLAVDGKDWRREQLLDRKHELRRLLAPLPVDSRLRYVDHVDRHGTALCDLNDKLAER